MSNRNGLAELLASRGFGGPVCVNGRSSVADLYKPGKRCGVYVLLFSDHQAYIGQSLDIVRRYAEHVRVYEDIEAVSFRQTAPDELDICKRELIGSVERAGYQLRNIVFSALPRVESDFDLVMSPENQSLWLSDLSYVDGIGPRIINSELRRKHASKFHRLRTNSGISEIIKKVRSYVFRGIPAIRRGEVSFWSLSCLPAYNNPEITLFMRLNINWQEVLTVFREKETGSAFFSLHLAREPVEQDVELLREAPGLEIDNHQYAPGGHDQINLTVPSATFDTLMLRPSIQKAIRRFNHRLMKKGSCNFGRYHCLDLADEVTEGCDTYGSDALHR